MEESSILKAGTFKANGHAEHSKWVSKDSRSKLEELIDSIRGFFFKLFCLLCIPTERNPCDESPCRNNATCVLNDDFTHTCQCPPGYGDADCGEGIQTYSCRIHSFFSVTLPRFSSN